MIDEIESFLELPDPSKARDEICTKAHLSIFPTYNEAIAATVARQLEASGATLPLLLKHLVDHYDGFIRYATSAIRASAGASMEQDYPPGYGKEEPWEVKEVLGLSKDFLLRQLIDHWVLKTRPELAEIYLKSCRVPSAKKEAKRRYQLLLASEQLA
jgi:hypothetical protein